MKNCFKCYDFIAIIWFYILRLYWSKCYSLHIVRQLRQGKCWNLHFLLDIFNWWFCIYMIIRNDFLEGAQRFYTGENHIFARKGSKGQNIKNLYFPNCLLLSDGWPLKWSKNHKFLLVFDIMYSYQTTGSGIFWPKRVKKGCKKP